MQIPKNGSSMISFIATLTIAYIAICFLLFIFQRQMIYFPASEVSVPGTAHTVLCVMGRSVGAAVATYLASKRDVEKLILVTPFDSAVNVGKKIYWFFPMGLILKERLDSAGRAAKITTDTLIIAAANDRIIPYEHTHNLVQAFSKTEVKVATLDGTGHNTVHLHPDYKKIIAAFMR